MFNGVIQVRTCFVNAIIQECVFCTLELISPYPLSIRVRTLNFVRANHSVSTSKKVFLIACIYEIN